MVRTPSSLRTGTTCFMAAWCAGANMKPKPTDAMHSATAAGSRSMRAPRASSTSAEPDRPVAERLPCFATAQPAAAATNAAVVDTLKVGLPPPVPAVSTSGARSTSTGTASSRMVRASPSTSSTVSPFVRSAIRKAAVSTSEARPSITSRSTAAAWSALMWRPAASASIARVIRGLGISRPRDSSLASREEIAQELLAVRRQYGLRVELDALRRQLAVPDAHDHLAVPGGALEAVGQGGLDDERVIAAGHERGFEAAEDRPAVVLDRRGLAVHGLAAHHTAPERVRERLQAHADAEHRDARLGRARDQLDRHAGVVRRLPGPGRDDHAVRPPRHELIGAGGVVAHHLQLGPELAQVLDEVVGERVVVVEDEDPHGVPPRLTPSPAGCTRA